MGTYNEPRPPSGEPTDGERDVWLANGEIRIGKWSSATSAWVRCSGYLPGLMDDSEDTCKVITGQVQNPTNWTIPEGSPSNTGYFKITIAPVAGSYVTDKKEFSITGFWGTSPNTYPIRIKNPDFVQNGAGGPTDWFLTCHLEDLAGNIYDRSSSPWNDRTLTINYMVYLYK